MVNESKLRADAEKRVTKMVAERPEIRQMVALLPPPRFLRPDKRAEWITEAVEYVSCGFLVDDGSGETAVREALRTGAVYLLELLAEAHEGGRRRPR